MRSMSESHLLNDPSNWSEEYLAVHLRAKRLGRAIDDGNARLKVIRTLREIEAFVLSPWTEARHPWLKYAGRQLRWDANTQAVSPAPEVMREMGARAFTYFEGCLREVPNSSAVLLDEVSYRRTASAGRNEHMLNEVRWFLDGHLAFAWNVIAHDLAIKTFDARRDEDALKRIMRSCWRVNQHHPIRFAVSLGKSHSTLEHPDFVQFIGELKLRREGHSFNTLWGKCEGDRAAVSALSEVHRFKAFV